MKTIRNGELKFKTLSDVHLENTRVGSMHVLRSLYLAIPDDEATAELDYLIIAGDLFDKAMDMASITMPAVMAWLIYLLRLCNKHDIRLRVVEGTPSHDRKQSALLVVLNDGLPEAERANLRYFDDLTIDHEEEFGFNMLYVPDEYHHDPDVVKSAVQDLMRKHGLDTVHVGVYHGLFKHQMDPTLFLPSLDSDFFCDIIEWFSTAGHVHKPSVYRTMFGNGSLERLRQNEEEAKGHYNITVRPGDPQPLTWKFIENKNAMFQRTLDVRGMDPFEADEFISSVVQDVQVGFCRLYMDGELNNTGILQVMRDKFPRLNWDSKVKRIKGDEADSSSALQSLKLRSVTQLTPANIVEKAMARIRAKAHAPQVVDRAKAILESVVND